MDRNVKSLVYVNNHYAGHAPTTVRRLRDAFLKAASAPRAPSESETGRRSPYRPPARVGNRAWELLRRGARLGLRGLRLLGLRLFGLRRLGVGQLVHLLQRLGDALLGALVRRDLGVAQ